MYMGNYSNNTRLSPSHRTAKFKGLESLHRSSTIYRINKRKTLEIKHVLIENKDIKKKRDCSNQGNCYEEIGLYSARSKRGLE